MVVHCTVGLGRGGLFVTRTCFGKCKVKWGNSVKTYFLFVYPEDDKQLTSNFDIRY